MTTGLIHKLFPEKKFGFIKDIKGENYFFHQQDFVGFWTSLCDDFTSNNRIEVEFRCDQTDKGLRARNVTRTNES